MPIVVRCRVCKKKIYVKPSHVKLGWGKYCSIACRSKSQLKGKNVQCHMCNSKIYRPPRMLTHSKSGKYFCTKSCQTLWRNSIFSGEKHPFWKNGKNVYRKILLRNGKKPVCALCSIVDKRLLNTHHIDHDRMNNKLENLIWLCLNCHYLVHHDKIADEMVRKIM